MASAQLWIDEGTRLSAQRAPVERRPQRRRQDLDQQRPNVARRLERGLEQRVVWLRRGDHLDQAKGKARADEQTCVVSKLASKNDEFFRPTHGTLSRRLAGLGGSALGRRAPIYARESKGFDAPAIPPAHLGTPPTERRAMAAETIEDKLTRIILLAAAVACTLAGALSG